MANKTKSSEIKSTETKKITKNSGSNKTQTNSRIQIKSEKVKVHTLKAHPLLTKIVLRAVTILTIALILVAAVYYGRKTFKNVQTERKHAMIDRQLSYCQELVTAKYKYSDIVTLKKSAGFAKSYSIVKYSGIIRAGIADFTDVSYSISRDGKKIKMKVPDAEILGNELIKQEIFDEKQSVFVPITTKEIFEEIEEARKDALEEMLAEGILDDATEYAKRIITQFMYSCGFDEVKF